jgi:hypothetical protein
MGDMFTQRRKAMTILTAVDGEQLLSKTVETGHELATAFDEEHEVLHVMSQ